MSYDDYTSADWQRLVDSQHAVIDGLKERIAYLEMQIKASGVTQRAALALWPVAAGHLVTGKAQSERINPEDVRRCAIRCWAMAEVFAAAAGQVLGSSESAGGK